MLRFYTAPIAVLSVLVFLAACSSSSTDAVVDGSPGDGSAHPDGAPHDGSTADSGGTTDGGGATDGGGVTDGGGTTDGGSVTDGGGTTDGGGATDGGSVTDGGGTIDGGSAMDGGSGTDGGSATDATTPVDAGPRDAALACGTMTCTGADICCVTMGSTGGVTLSCAPSCADGSVPIACETPADCGGDPCCVPVVGARPSGSMCTTAPTDCMPSVSFATMSGMTRGCSTDTDCTSGVTGTSQLPTCCSFTYAGTTVHACAETLLVGIVPGLTCP